MICPRCLKSAMLCQCSTVVKAGGRAVLVPKEDAKRLQARREMARKAA